MICPTCNCQMSHDNDFTYDDLGYIGEGTVSFYECLNCGTMIEVDVPEETNINRKE